MKLISFNVNGVRASVKKGLVESLHGMDADIYCLQETKATPDQVKEALAELNGYHIYAHSGERKGYSGTAILSKEDPVRVDLDIGMDEHDQEGRVIAAKYAGFTVVNTYVPNAGQGLRRLDYRKGWDGAMLAYLKDHMSNGPLIWTGDLNVAHRPIDIKNDKSNYNKTAGYTQVEIDGMDAYHKAGLVDTFREKYPDMEKYSWWSFRANSRANNVGWRIDYVLVSPDFAPKVKDAFILNEIEGSDHCPVGITW